MLVRVVQVDIPKCHEFRRMSSEFQGFDPRDEADTSKNRTFSNRLPADPFEQLPWRKFIKLNIPRRNPDPHPVVSLTLMSLP